MPVGLHHVSIFTVDVQRSLRLFRDILGLKLLWQAPVGGRKLAALMGLPEVEAELFYLQNEAGGPALELIRLIRPERSEIPPLLGSRGSVTLSLQVKEIESLHRRLQEEGWTPHSSCLQLFTPQGQAVKLFSLRTEEGLSLEFIEELEPAAPSVL
ncbi:MAG: VOC family protein [Deltaproteobacteria bacterium]|nr:VOC family protein [Deltaproteobacteria bacterium]